MPSRRIFYGFKLLRLFRNHRKECRRSKSKLQVHVVLVIEVYFNLNQRKTFTQWRLTVLPD